MIGSPRDFCWWVSALINCDPLYHNFGNGNLPHDLGSLLGQRKVVDFQFAQPFSSVVGRDNVQALCQNFSPISLQFFIMDIFKYA